MGTVQPIPTLVPERAPPRPGRTALKRVALAVAWIFVSPLAFGVWLEQLLRRHDSERVFDGSKELLAYSPGLLGQYLRTAFYASVCRAVSADARFSLGSIVSTRDVAIGAGSVVGVQSIVGRSEIGRDVQVPQKPNVAADHGHRPMRD